MTRLDKALLAFVLSACVAIVYLNKPATAAPVNLTIQDALGALVPVQNSSSCRNTSLAALTPTLVASGTALHAAGVDSKAFQVSVADDDAVAGTCSDCWFVMTSSETAATKTGVHIPKGAIVPMRLPGDTAYLKGSCVGACIVGVCPLN